MTSPGVISAEDRFAIEDVLGRYLWAVDTGDLPGVLAVFEPDAVVRYAGGNRYQGEEGLKDFAVRAIGDASAAGRMHLNRSLFAEAIRDTVLLRSYVIVPQSSDGEEGVRITAIRYTEDRLRKNRGGWRIYERVIYAGPPPALEHEHEQSASST